MSANPLELHSNRSASLTTGWRELWLKEDWWAIWVGLGIVVVGYLLFANGLSLKWIAVTPEKWTTLGQLGAHFVANGRRYLALFALWQVVFAVALTALGHSVRDFVPSFVFVYVFSVVIFTLGQWTQANYYNLEPPLVALLLGLLISNVAGLPRLRRRVADSDRGFARLQPGGIQQGGESDTGRPDQRSENLDVHLLLLQHRPDDADRRSGEGGPTAVCGIQRRSARQRAARVRPLRLRLRVRLGESGAPGWTRSTRFAACRPFFRDGPYRERPIVAVAADTFATILRIWRRRCRD